MLALSLSEALNQIQAVFDIETLLQSHEDLRFTRPSLLASIDQYFKQSEIGYRKYHSQEGSIHLAINDNGVFDPAGYLTQPRQVAQQIEAITERSCATQAPQHFLEVGSGKGFNCRFLADRFPEAKILGLDLMPFHVKLAQRTAKAYANLNFRVGSFERTDLADQSMDLIFGVECLCYAQDIQEVLAELYRVLKPGGQLVIFDGYRKPGFKQQSTEWQTATRLVEIGMVVLMGFRSLETWLRAAETVGFRVVVCEDRTVGILPNLEHLQGLAERFFKRKWRSRLVKLLAPPYLLRNAVTGLLMRFTCDPVLGTHSYHYLVLEKMRY
jgi:SAM-dependent methyltransferase